MRLSVLPSFIVFFALGCGLSEHKDGSSQEPAVPQQGDSLPNQALASTCTALPAAAEPSLASQSGQLADELLFSAIDPMALPWKSSLYRLNLRTKESTRLLSGESGDAALFASGDEILFFNRSADSQNYRRLSYKTHEFVISPQQKFADGHIGDPHDSLFLGNDRVLLAHYTQGSLAIMEQSTGKKLAVVEADWDLPPGTSLKPEALVAAQQEDGKRKIYVIHQGLSFKQGLMQANGTQHVFVLQQEGETIKPVDLSPDQPRIQGIKLRGSFPLVVRSEAEQRILLVSMCSRYIAAASADGAHQCAAAIEEIDPKTDTAKVIWDLEGLGLFMNGPVSPGPAGSIYAHVEQKQDTGQFAKHVMQLNLRDCTFMPVYTFKSPFGGFWASFYDKGSKTFFIGDIGETSTGKFVLLSEDGTKTELPLPAVPYSGAFLPRSSL